MMTRSSEECPGLQVESAQIVVALGLPPGASLLEPQTYILISAVVITFLTSAAVSPHPH